MVGLTVTHCNYIGGPDFHMLNLHGTNWGKTFAHRVLMRLSRIVLEIAAECKAWKDLSSAVGCAAYQHALYCSRQPRCLRSSNLTFLLFRVLPCARCKTLAYRLRLLRIGS